MITVRQIDDSELFQLIKLNYEYYQCLTVKQNYYGSTSVLIELLRKPGAYALGLFRDKELIGFTIGHSYTETIFYFTSLYVVPKYRIYTKRLYEASENRLRGLYFGWAAVGTNKEGINIHKKMGAKVMGVSDEEIKFYKEL